MQKLISLVFLLSFTLLSTSLFAHAKMVTSIPANNASYDTPLAAIELSFKAPSRLLKISLKKDDNRKIPLNFKPSAQAKDRFSIALPTLEKGDYILEWTILGNDGHKMKSKVTFKQT